MNISNQDKRKFIAVVLVAIAVGLWTYQFTKYNYEKKLHNARTPDSVDRHVVDDNTAIDNNAVNEICEAMRPTIAQDAERPGWIRYTSKLHPFTISLPKNYFDRYPNGDHVVNDCINRKGHIDTASESVGASTNSGDKIFSLVVNHPGRGISTWPNDKAIDAFVSDDGSVVVTGLRTITESSFPADESELNKMRQRDIVTMVSLFEHEGNQYLFWHQVPRYDTDVQDRFVEIMETIRITDESQDPQLFTAHSVDEGEDGEFRSALLGIDFSYPEELGDITLEYRSGDTGLIFTGGFSHDDPDLLIAGRSRDFSTDLGWGPGLEDFNGYDERDGVLYLRGVDIPIESYEFYQTDIGQALILDHTSLDLDVFQVIPEGHTAAFIELDNAMDSSIEFITIINRHNTHMTVGQMKTFLDLVKKL